MIENYNFVKYSWPRRNFKHSSFFITDKTPSKNVKNFILSDNTQNLLKNCEFIMHVILQFVNLIFDMIYLLLYTLSYIHFEDKIKMSIYNLKQIKI